MLAGYLPFDDDPANPEGDNINLLYKYIVNTPLTFPEYVSPHARDMLRRILVPNPRKRADLFEVARHSWLSEYASVVRVITSSTTTPIEIQNTTVPAEDDTGATGMARSASVREASKPKTGTATSTVGGLSTKHGHLDADEAAAAAKAQKDAKRRTVQVEYVAPTTQTQRGEYAMAGKTRTRTDGPVEASRSSAKEKPLPRDPPVSADAYGKPSSRQSASAHRHNLRHEPDFVQTTPETMRRDRPDNPYSPNATTQADPAQHSGRPQTGNSIQSGASMGFTAAGRGSTYGQPVPPSIAGTNVQGRIQQPSTADGNEGSRPSVPSKFAMVTGFAPESAGSPSVEAKGHKRSSTIGDISSKLLGRSGSLFGRSRKRTEATAATADKNDRKYPPLSMANTRIMGDETRPSMDSRQSRRSFSIGLGRKRSGSMNGSQESQEKGHNRRFSLLPSITKAIGLGSDKQQSQQSLPLQSPSANAAQANNTTPIYDSMRGSGAQHQAGDRAYQSQPQLQSQYGPPSGHERRPSAIPAYMQQRPSVNAGAGSDSSVDLSGRRYTTGASPYQQGGGGFSASEGYDGRRVGNGRQTGGGGKVLQKTKRFADAYDEHPGREGSSGAAKRVMDFFRRRGKARGGEER